MTARSNEFTSKYVETRNKLLERKEEKMHDIVDHTRQMEEVRFKKQEAIANEAKHNKKNGIRDDSKLKVHIVDARNLRDQSHMVNVSQDNSYAGTNWREGAAPIWNEAIVFDISDPNRPVIIELVN